MSSEATYSVTFKTPKGNLVTVRGDTAADWKANLEAASSSRALAAVAEIEASLAGQPANPTTQAAPGGHQASQVQPSASPATAAGPQAGQELPSSFAVTCKTCQGPTRFEREDVSPRDGKRYKKYVCTTTQLHKPTFIDA